MPYISPERREALVKTRCPETMGELNWQITAIVCDYVVRKGLSYQSIGEVTGALVNAKDEFYRRIAVPYENAKAIANGDVYPEFLLP